MQPARRACRKRVDAQESGIEKIGIDRIVLSRIKDGVSVILYTLKDADHRVAAWAKMDERPFVCRVDVRYIDGKSLGNYTVEWHPVCGRPSISNYIRANFLAGSALKTFPSAAQLRALEVATASATGLRSEATEFFERYELRDT